MKKQSLLAFMESLDKLSTEDLKSLNTRVCSLLQVRHTMRQMTAAAQFSVGDRAEFRDRYGRTVQIKLIKINTKSMVGVTDDGMRWKVAPSLCKKVVSVEPKRRVRVSAGG